MSQGFVRGIVGLFPVFFLLFVANSQQSPAAGIFTTAYLGGNSANPPDLDASIGLSTGKTYLTAVNFNGSAVTINGVPFAASSGGNPSGTDYSISGIPDTYSGFTSQVSGNLGTLLSSFIYGGSPGEYNFSGLTPGQTYVITYYGVSFDPAGERVQNLTTSDGATGTYDVDMDAPAAGYANLLRYTFQATAATETITATPQVSGYTLHTYGLSMEQTFNNTTSPSGNTNWMPSPGRTVLPRTGPTRMPTSRQPRPIRPSRWIRPRHSATCSLPAPTRICLAARTPLPCRPTWAGRPS